MGFDFNTFMQRIAIAIMLKRTKVPTVNATQSLKILTESNIIRIGRVAFDVPIDTIESPKICMVAVNSTAMLQCAYDIIGCFFIEKPRSVLMADNIETVNLF